MPEFRACSTPEVDDNLVETLRAALGVSRVVATLLVLRGLTTPDDARAFLSPSLDRDWLGPQVLPHMDEAAQTVADAIRAKRHIVVFGDFDVDGVTSSATLLRGLHALGAADASAVIPRRLEEGYGLTLPSVTRLLAENPDLVITVDNGISAAAEVKVLLDAGVEVVVTDHHEPGQNVPTDVVVVDPKMDGSCPSRDLAGVGVALKLIQAVGALLGQPDLWRGLVDIATLGTIGDQMPLKGENRALVSEGVRMMNLNPSQAIIAFEAANPKGGPITADGLSFSLLPRINSAGRMGDALAALDLLMADDPSTAAACMAHLDEINTARRTAEAQCADDALAQAEKAAPGSHVLVLASPDWHEGVKGIVASRVVDRSGLPAILFTITPDGLAHGSGRSVGSLNLYQAVSECSDLLVRFGGHGAAVGVTLEASRIDEFRDRLEAVVAAVPQEQLAPRATADMEVSLSEVTLSLVDELAILAPFGQANRLPVFVCTALSMEDRRRMGNPPVHFSCTVTDGLERVRAIYFRPANLDGLMDTGEAVDMVFCAEKNEFRGRSSVQMMVKEILPSGGEPPHQESETDGFVERLFDNAEECLDHGDYAGILDAESFHTKVAGVSFEGRQDVLAKLVVPSELQLVREPGNTYDASAIAVMCDGRQLGYLNTRLAQRLAPAMDAGMPYAAVLEEITGGNEDRALGANILVCRQDMAESQQLHLDELAQRRLRWQALPPDELADRVRHELIGDSPLHDAQAESLEYLAAGKSVLTVMATGRGKSLIFHLHSVVTALKQGQASIFIYPLRALVADQAYHLQSVFDTFGLQVRVLTGETAQDERDEVFQGLGDGQVDCVLTTPEFLSIHAGRFAETGRVGFLVVDEAHHMGGDRSAYNSLGPVLEALGLPTVLAVTATASTPVARRICADLRIDHVVLDSTVRENLSLVDNRGIKGREAQLANLIAQGNKTVVYVNSREQTVQLARMLRKTLPATAGGVAFYNAGVARTDRTRIESAFRDGQLNTIISTSAFGEGVDIPDIRNVVLYHLPFSSVEFNQMAGRCGRDGAQAQVHLLYGKVDARINERILESSAPPRRDMIALYRVLRRQQDAAGAGEWWSAANAALADASVAMDSGTHLNESGVSCGIQVFRELGLMDSAGYGAARRLNLKPAAGKVDLDSSTRYLEGRDELSAFDDFREWALSAPANELLERFNRPLMPKMEGLIA